MCVFYIYENILLYVIFHSDLIFSKHSALKTHSKKLKIKNWLSNLLLHNTPQYQSHPILFAHICMDEHPCHLQFSTTAMWQWTFSYKIHYGLLWELLWEIYLYLCLCLCLSLYFSPWAEVLSHRVYLFLIWLSTTNLLRRITVPVTTTISSAEGFCCLTPSQTASKCSS